MVIDDEESIRILISDVLEEAGYRILEAQDGPTGLKILQSDARIDLLITDVGLLAVSTVAKWPTRRGKPGPT